MLIKCRQPPIRCRLGPKSRWPLRFIKRRWEQQVLSGRGGSIAAIDTASFRKPAQLNNRQRHHPAEQPPSRHDTGASKRIPMPPPPTPNRLPIRNATRQPRSRPSPAWLSSRLRDGRSRSRQPRPAPRDGRPHAGHAAHRRALQAAGRVRVGACREQADTREGDQQTFSWSNSVFERVNRDTQVAMESALCGSTRRRPPAMPLLTEATNLLQIRPLQREPRQQHGKQSETLSERLFNSLSSAPGLQGASRVNT